MASRRFDELNDKMLARLFSINPDCATIFGKHDPYDRLLPHGGYQKIDANLRLLGEWFREATETTSNESVSRDQEVSLKVLDYTLQTYRFVVDDYPLWKMRPDALENPGTAMLMMCVRDYAPIDKRLESMAARIGEIPEYLERFRDRFTGVRTVRNWTENALNASKAFPSFLSTVRKMADANADSRVRSMMKKGIGDATDALELHDEWLRKMLDSSTDDFAMGRDSYAKLLKIRGIQMTPEELVELSYQYLGDFKNRRERVARRISKDGGIEKARKIIEADHPRSIDEVVDRTSFAVEDARQFVINQDIATVLPGTRVHVMKVPDFLSESITTAATYLPAVFEKSQDTVYLIGATDSPEQLGSVWDYPAIESTAVHEAYPGHHHQGVMSNRKPWMHQLPHIIYSPETLSPPYESQEGWATYCEAVMEERGFTGSDLHALGELDYSVSTACRAISEVKIACKEATVSDMVEMTAKETGYSKAMAKGDVEGFTRMPGYGICYLLGRHLVVGFKADLRKQMGGKFSEKRFNDLVAENGNLPFYLLEQEVRRELLSQNTAR